MRIGWSFFAGALGAWVISGPPSYTASGYGYGAGAIGLVFYSLSSGLPVIMVAFAGELIRVRERARGAGAQPSAPAAAAPPPRLGLPGGPEAPCSQSARAAGLGRAGRGSRWPQFVSPATCQGAVQSAHVHARARQASALLPCASRRLTARVCLPVAPCSARCPTCCR